MQLAEASHVARKNPGRLHVRHEEIDSGQACQWCHTCNNA